MATTPNYGWVTPAPTDFVVSLPADFETFADAVDADFAHAWQRIGGSTLSAATTAVYNDVFSASYRAYKIILSDDFSIDGDADARLLLRASGSNSTGNYAGQGFRYVSTLTAFSSGTPASAAGSWTLKDAPGSGAAQQHLSMEITLIDPFVAQRTKVKCETSQASSTVSYGYFMTGLHTATTSYDGFQLDFGGTKTMTGKVDIYGIGL